MEPYSDRTSSLLHVTASPPASLGTASTNLAGIASLGMGTVAPVFTTSPASLAFGAVNVNTTSQAQTVTLANTGNAPLNVTALATSSPRYTASPSGTLPPIAAGQSTTVQVTFTPTAVQSYPAALTMTTNDPSHPSVSIPVTGSGGQAAAAWTPACPLDFGTVETGATASTQPDDHQLGLRHVARHRDHRQPAGFLGQPHSEPQRRTGGKPNHTSHLQPGCG